MAGALSSLRPEGLPVVLYLKVRIAIGRGVGGRFLRRVTVNPLGDVSFGVEGAVAAWRSAFPAGAVDSYPCSWR